MILGNVFGLKNVGGTLFPAQVVNYTGTRKLKIIKKKLDLYCIFVLYLVEMRNEITKKKEIKSYE